MNWIAHADGDDHRIDAFVLDADAHVIRVWHKDVLNFTLTSDGTYIYQGNVLRRSVVLRPRKDSEETVQ